MSKSVKTTEVVDSAILQAIQDGTDCPAIGERNGLDLLRRDAHRFMKATDGEWAEARAAVCDAAGLCPDRLKDAYERPRGVIIAKGNVRKLEKAA